MGFIKYQKSEKIDVIDPNTKLGNLIRKFSKKEIEKDLFEKELEQVSRDENDD